MNAAENELYDIYLKNEQKCRKYSKRLGCYILFHMQVFVAAFLYSMYCIYRGNFDTSIWPLPFNYAVPFDETTVWGWYLMWFIQTNSAISYVSGVLSTTSYFMACCLYIDAICNHFELLVYSIDKATQQYLTEMNQTRKLKLRRKIKESFIDTVKQHVEILE